MITWMRRHCPACKVAWTHNTNDRTAANCWLCDRTGIEGGYGYTPLSDAHESVAAEPDPAIFNQHRINWGAA